MLRSLFSHSPRASLRVHIVHNGLAPRSSQNLARIALPYKNQIYFHEVDLSDRSAFIVRENDHVSIMSYCRLLLPQILPEYVDKVVYLDPDLVVRRSVSPLADLSLGSNLVAAVQDVAVSQAHKSSIQFPLAKRYFNAGVLVFSLKEWRQERISELLIAQLDRPNTSYPYWDQDVLNLVLQDRVLFLPLHWNLIDQLIYHPEYAESLGLTKQDYGKTITDPCIVHFIGPSVCKPWYTECKNPFRNEFRLHLRKTPWRITKLKVHKERPNCLERIGGFLTRLGRRMLRAVGLPRTWS